MGQVCGMKVHWLALAMLTVDLHGELVGTICMSPNTNRYTTSHCIFNDCIVATGKEGCSLTI